MLIVYSSNNCVNCQQSKSKLDELSIEYKDKNIMEDFNAKKRVLEKGFLSVPVFEYKDSFYNDLDEVLSLL